jgi:hypothetical protein
VMTSPHHSSSPCTHVGEGVVSSIILYWHDNDLPKRRFVILWDRVGDTFYGHSLLES